MVIYNPIWVPSQPCLCWGLDERPNPWDFGTIFYCLASNLPNLQQVPNSERPSGWSWVMIPFWSGVWAQNGKSIPKEWTLSATKPEERKVPELSQQPHPHGQHWVIPWSCREFLQKNGSLGRSSIAVMWEVLTSTTKSPEIAKNSICPSPTRIIELMQDTQSLAAAAAQLVCVYLK